MKDPHVPTAVIETSAGLALLSFPSSAAELLLGARLDAPAAVILGRLAGVALLALGIACWLARNDSRSPAGRGLMSGMLLYNLAAVALLSWVALGPGPAGLGCWPAIVLHSGMSAWCLAWLRGQSRRPTPAATSRQVSANDPTQP